MLENVEQNVMKEIKFSFTDGTGDTYSVRLVLTDTDDVFVELSMIDDSYNRLDFTLKLEELSNIQIASICDVPLSLIENAQTVSVHEMMEVISNYKGK